MSLEVTVSVNGNPIIQLQAVNRGTSEASEAADPEGWRNYEWRIDGTPLPYTIRHKRSAGAAFLAGTLLCFYLNETQKEQL